MEKKYSAQNIAAFIIYELNDSNVFVNANTLQILLHLVNEKWIQVFGSSPYSEQSYSLHESGYIIKEVFDAYKEFGDEPLTAPAKEWILKYGQFQFIVRSYGIPPFNEQEEKLVNEVLHQYRLSLLKNVS